MQVIGTHNETKTGISAADLERLSDGDVLAWHGGNKLKAEDADKIVAHVQNGGGLLIAGQMYDWVTAQRMEDYEMLQKYPGNK